MGKRVPPSRQLEQVLFEGMLTSGDSVGEACRRGAQLILWKAVEMEVEDFLGRGHYERAREGLGRGYRNGYEPKKVHHAGGAIELGVPQIRENPEPFDSVWLRAIGTRSRSRIWRNA